MTKNIAFVAGAAILALLLAVFAPSFFGVTASWSNRFAWGLIVAIPAGVMAFLGVHFEQKEGKEAVAAVRQDMGRLKRDYVKLKDSVEASRHKVVQVTSLINTLSGIAKATNQSLETKKVITFVMDILQRQLGARKASLWLVDPETGKIDFEDGIGWKEDDKAEAEVTMGRGPIGHSIANGIYLDRVIIRQDPTLAALKKDAGVPSIMCSPLLHNNEAIGALNIEEVDRKRHADSKDDSRLMEFVASLAAMAIKNARMFGETRERANTDGLTKLFTHRYFQDAFDAELRRADRYGDFVSIILTDIDHFKKFNDTYGHQIGDLVLKETAQVFKQAVREMDIVARYGGEEFTIVLPQTNKTGAVKLADRLRQAVEKRAYETEKGTLHVTISLGVSTFPVDAREKTQLIKLADQALYGAKEGGRNCVRFHRPQA